MRPAKILTETLSSELLATAFSGSTGRAIHNTFQVTLAVYRETRFYPCSLIAKATSGSAPMAADSIACGVRYLMSPRMTTTCNQFAKIDKANSGWLREAIWLR